MPAIPAWRKTPRKCQHCGAEYLPRDRKQRFCSGDCRRKHYTVVYGLKPCAFCGRSFLPKQAAQKYCCPKCADDADARNRQAKNPWRNEVRTCVICGDKFTPRTYHQKTCCPKCRDELNTINSKHKTPATPSDSMINRGTGLAYSRKCHDCGKPTNDYRCPRCLAKWRNKYHVSGNEQLESYTTGRSVS